MHVIHRPHLHLPRIVMITVVAAVLAMAVSLIMASAVSNLQGSSSGASPRSTGVPAVHEQAPAVAWNRNPFTPVFTAPILTPWTKHVPFRAG